MFSKVTKIVILGYLAIRGFSGTKWSKMIKLKLAGFGSKFESVKILGKSNRIMDLLLVRIDSSAIVLLI